MRKIQSAAVILKRRGVKYLWNIFRNYLIPKWFFTIMIREKLMLKIIRRSFFLFRIKEKRMLQLARKLQINHAEKINDRVLRWEEWQVSEEVRSAVNQAKKGQTELVLAEFDSDGKISSKYGKFPFLKTVASSEFIKKERFSVEIVLKDNFVLVKKRFGRAKRRFLNEWLASCFLADEEFAPNVYFADEKNNILYKSLISGKTLRDSLADSGAEILLSQTQNDSELAKLDTNERLWLILERGSKNLGQAVSGDIIEKLETAMDKIHAKRITGFSLTFGNVLVDSRTEQPCMIDFEGSRFHHKKSSLAFCYFRDLDRQKFNRIYKKEILTEKSAREALTEVREKIEKWYAPIDFGMGFTTDGFWSTDNGTGRWEYFNRDVVSPFVKSKTVLDLGSNNGSMPLCMLRNGAKKVVGIEYSKEFAEAAATVHRIFNWRDIRNYDFTLHNGNMLEILDRDFGNFDVVTAFCSLYYLSKSDMAKVVRKSSEIAPTMILQAKTNARPAAKEKGEKSSVEFLKSLLENNGFPKVQVFERKDFTRPILIGLWN